MAECPIISMKEGRYIICEDYLDQTRTCASQGAVSAINMPVNNAGGSDSSAEIPSWMKQNGYADNAEKFPGETF